MDKQVLSIEQMQELIELNFTPKFIHKFSSMMWVKYPNPYPPAQKENSILTRLVPASGEYYGVEDIDYIPTFTLQDILKMLPYNVEGAQLNVNLAICCISYENPRIKVCWYDNNILEAAFEMLKWCKENGYI